MSVPEAYYQFVMDYAPYLYVTPGVGPDLTWGKAALAAGFAVDFLYEAYFNPQFDDRSEEIEIKIGELADWILTQQITDSQTQAYGGFVSAEGSTICYSVDVGRCAPALLKAYELTSSSTYLLGAQLAVGTFLYNTQHAPEILGIHDLYYGGFTRAVDTADAWLPQMDVEALYNLRAITMLCDVDPINRTNYQTMIQDAANFYRPGLEALALYFDPKPSGDAGWHRVGLGDDTVYDDSIAYALLGLYDYEDYSITVAKTYQALNAIGASPKYPAYNPAVCWGGYLNVKAKTLACDYYDAVAAGILSKIRMNHDKTAYDFSAKIILSHPREFMFWGPKHATYAPLENKQAMATVCWLGQYLSDYTPPLTRFTQILSGKGENLTLYPLVEAGDKPNYGEAIPIKAIVLPQKTEELFLEAGYVVSDYLALHVFAPLRRHDKVTRNGVDYEVVSIQDFTFRNELFYYKVILRRMLN